MTVDDYNLAAGSGIGFYEGDLSRSINKKRRCEKRLYMNFLEIGGLPHHHRAEFVAVNNDAAFVCV